MQTVKTRIHTSTYLLRCVFRASENLLNIAPKLLIDDQIDEEVGHVERARTVAKISAYWSELVEGVEGWHVRNGERQEQADADLQGLQVAFALLRILTKKDVT